MWIRGSELSPRQRQLVLAAFIYRWTVENHRQAKSLFGTAPGRAPTIAPIPDADWLVQHAFCFVRDGSRLSARVHHCDPVYLH